MNVNKLFTLAFAAMAFAACSNEEDFTKSEVQAPQGELINAISISFGNSRVGTRAINQSTVGIGTENDIYEAFIFAKEVAPKHTRPKVGDWTVIRVVANDQGQILSETGDVITDQPPLPSKDQLTNPLNSRGGSENWKVENIATFSGVRQGDNVYVIANDPNLTLAEATALAHKGVDSENSIKEYTLALQKEYLDGLKYYPESSQTAAPTGRYVMAGKQQIPTSPTIPSDGTVTVSVGLDRELAKVNFRASVTTDSKDAAYGKVEFMPGDGIMVSRIARSASMFTQKTPEWYVPSTNNVVNWPAAGNTPETSLLFDGTSTVEIQDWLPGVNAPANFNKVAPAGAVTEYRYSWTLDKDKMTDKNQPVYLSQLTNGTLVAPVFYTTPNYSGNTNSVTTIVTQATYMGEDLLVNDKLQSYINSALALTAGGGIYFLDPEDANGQAVAAMVTNPIDSENMKNRIKANLEAFGRLMPKDQNEFNVLKDAITDTNLSNAVSTDYNQYAADMDALYLATILLYRSQNAGSATEGTDGKKIFFNDPESDKKATDALLLGEGQTFSIGKSAAGWDTVDEAAFIAQPAKTARAAYFSNKESFSYLKGTKVYYRADVADYVNGISTFITERNTMYDSRGTIKSLGATSIEDAIMSASNAMHVDVTINDWKLSANDIDM